jgi:tripeptidyl-peptidase-2
MQAAEQLVAKYEDLGPVLDCVVFHDGTVWRAALDVSGGGDLSAAAALADFRHAREFARLSEEDQMNYSFKIYNDGNLLSIVVNAGAHGTHVAGSLS